MRPIAGNAALRVFQNSWRSVSSRATRTSSDPHASQIFTTSSKRASHSSSAPSSSTSRAAPRPTGYPALAICSLASIASLSIISIAPGTTPLVTISPTASPAACVESKNATSVFVVSGTGTTRSQAFVATPSVPSEPTNAPSRSYPGASSSAPPSQIISPSGSTTSRPVTYVVVKPYLKQCAPPEFSATLPPIEQTIWLDGSGGKKCVGATARETSMFVTPGSTTTRWFGRATSTIRRRRVSAISTPSSTGSAPPDKPDP